MGNNCSCLKSKSDDEYQLHVIEEERPESKAPPLLSKQTFKHSDIIKIQGILRGFLDRRKAQYMNYTGKSEAKTSSAIYLVTRASTHKSMRSGENTPNTSFCGDDR
ncbi:unnamed protein product [Blepharisma stoltei]|uniref:Uncharacterized protein n=1 Tax=Blepharisma stoltei TaxID=1481888 RepID=A0AAU9K5A2_9CILI|nr:unnamed protein product [Blepharisma stoltei]